jgi:hypothetical protein
MFLPCPSAYPQTFRAGNLVFYVSGADGRVGSEVKGHTIEAPIVLTKILKGMQIAGGWLRDTQGEMAGFPGTRRKRRLMSSSTKSGIPRSTSSSSSAGSSPRCGTRLTLHVVTATRSSRLEVRLRRPSWNTDWRSLPKRRLDCVLSFRQPQGAKGLDFSAADTAVYYSLPAGLLPYDQSSARIRKWKDKRTLTYFYLAARGTVDELAYLAIQEGLEVVDMVQHHPTLLKYEAEG